MKQSRCVMDMPRPLNSVPINPLVPVHARLAPAVTATHETIILSSRLSRKYCFHT